jgi:hypothetical protein
MTYEICIRGRASRQLLRPLLDEFSITHDEDSNTHLIGVIVDQAQLHGVLARLTQLNAELLSVVRTDPSPAPTHDLPEGSGGTS